MVKLKPIRFSRGKKRSAAEIANIIDRFLKGSSLYPQEWSDFVEWRERDSALEHYRKRCYKLDPLVNSPFGRDKAAIAELQDLVKQLRKGANSTALSY